MSAVDDVEKLIEHYQLATAEFVKGSPEPYKALFSHREEAITVLLCLIDEPARRLLELDLKERPFITLQEERCESLEAVSGVSVSRSTMCRAIARMDSTRERGTFRHRA